MFSEVTSADLSVQVIAQDNKISATTLQMSALKTSNETDLPALFQINGLIPGGFDVSSIRLKKDGELDFNYQLKSVKVNGDDNFCHSLNIKIMQDNKFIYQGKIGDLDNNKTINGLGKDDWIFFVSLDDNNDQLKNQNCEFTFDFKTYRNSPDEIGGFSDEVRVTNYVSSGSW